MYYYGMYLIIRCHYSYHYLIHFFYIFDHWSMILYLVPMYRSCPIYPSQPKLATDKRHRLYNHSAANRRVKSRKKVLSSVGSLSNQHQRSLDSRSVRILTSRVASRMESQPKELLPIGAIESMMYWKCLNRLHSGVGRSKESMHKWGYTTSFSTMCDCSQKLQTMQHLF